MISSCTTTGVPRITVRYTLQMAFSNLNFPVRSWVERMIPTRNPSTIPMSTAKRLPSGHPRPLVISFPSVIFDEIFIKRIQKSFHSLIPLIFSPLSSTDCSAAYKSICSSHADSFPHSRTADVSGRAIHADVTRGGSAAYLFRWIILR